ncbi:MAG: PAS domain-containing protein [Desulfomonilaceae bacterium]|jgi:PAS domain S-box-containing protein
MVKKMDLDKNRITTSHLRGVAEEKLSKLQNATQNLEEKTPEEIIHELQVHQIELEMQNEELRRVQLELEESRDNYQILYDFSPLGYFTLTHKGLVTEVNLTGAALLGMPRSKLIKRGFGRFVSPESEGQWYQYIVTVLGHAEKQSCDLTLKRADGSIIYARLESIRIEALVREGGVQEEQPCQIHMALMDITERKRLEDEKEQVIIELSEALSNVKKLSRFLPICASCKKIRDDTGYWNEIESYISEHSETQFSHSICPDCMRKLYPEIADEISGRLNENEK